MRLPHKTVVAREWIIFSLSVGLGGHLALGVLLHTLTPDRWQEMGGKALLFGLVVYVAVQTSRALYLAIRANRAKHNA